IERRLRRARRIGFGRRLRTTGQDDALGREPRDLGRIVVPGPDFAVHAELADAAGDQLRVLRAEIEDQDLVVVDVGHGVRGSLMRRGRRMASLGIESVSPSGSWAVPW